MTEQELRARLNRMTGEIPAETHQAYLSAVLRGKDEVRVKRKIPAGLVFAILAVIFVKPVVIIMTALMGGLLFADQIFEYLVQVRWDPQLETLIRLGTGAGLGLIGIIFQFVTTRGKE